MAPTSIFDHIDNYCERTSFAFWSEPLNAVTNLSFLIAAWMLFKLYRSTGQKDREVEGLISCITVVGIGSFTFHTFATYIAMMADVFPIVMFVCYYLLVAFRRLMGWGKLAAFAGMVVFLLIGAKTEGVPTPYNFNGSVAYFPCLAALLLMAWQTRRTKHPSSPILVQAAGCFAVSLLFRSIDQSVCAYFPIGTHFLWHCLNGYVLYLLGKSVLKPATQ